MKAFVQIISNRGRDVGYGVYGEWFENGIKQGKCLAIYRWIGGRRFKNCDSWEIALHLANKHRDDVNAGLTED